MVRNYDRLLAETQNNREVLTMPRLVVVSNRVPLPSERGAKAGGLAVALTDALQPGSLWFGWSGRRSARGSSTTHIQRSDGVTYATIDLTESEYQSFYVNFSNGLGHPGGLRYFWKCSKL